MDMSATSMVEFAHWWMLRAAWAIDFLVPDSYAMYRPAIMWYVVFGFTLASYIMGFKFVLWLLRLVIYLVRHLWSVFTKSRNEPRV